MTAKRVQEEIDTLLALAERFAALGFAEAASVLKRLASSFSSDASEASAETLRSPASPETLTQRGREHENRAIDANHFVGLAALYADRGAPNAAVECLQMAKEKAKALPAPYKLHGRILFQQRNLSGAAEELAKALRYNPFDREVAELYGEVEYEQRHFESAMTSTIDAFLLVSDEHSEDSGRLRRRIRTLKRVLEWDNSHLIQVFHERQQRLGTAFERLQWRRHLFLEEMGILEKGLFRTATLNDGGSRIELAARLRKLELWSHLPDEAVFRLTQAVAARQIAAGTSIFVDDDGEADLCFVESGGASVQRGTSSGDVALRIVGAGDLLGEECFVLGVERWGQAIATEPSQVLLIDSQALRNLIKEAPFLGVQIYSSLWHALARKLRTANELLRRIFARQTASSGAGGRQSAGGTSDLTEQKVQVDSEAKIQLFTEQGLSRRELLTLATFSNERHYDSGAFLFREGDEGSEMYAILEGQVRISKFFPGAGEEALSILKRGDFFGELSLIDGQPRSADAQAHDGPVTVLALDQSIINEVVGMDPRASLDFVQLLCRLLASRLKEVDERLVLWQILSLHQGPTPLESMPAFPPST